MVNALIALLQSRSSQSEANVACNAEESVNCLGCKRAAPWLGAAQSLQWQRPLNRRCEYVDAVGRVSGVRLHVEGQEGVGVAPYSSQPLVIAQKVATRDRGGLDVKAPATWVSDQLAVLVQSVLADWQRIIQ